MAEEYVWTQITLLGNIGLIIIWTVFFNSVLTRRFSLPITILCYAAGWFLGMYLTNSLAYASLIRYLSSVLAYTVPPLLLFREKWYKSLFVSVMVMVFMTISDIITVTLLYTPEMLKEGVGAQTPIMQFAAFALCLPLNAFFLWLFALILNRYKNQLSTTEWLLYPLFPLSQFVLLYGWIAAAREALTFSRIGFLLAAMGVCVIADFALFFTIRSLAQKGRLRSENELFSRQLSIQKGHYSAIVAQYESIRRVRHDIADHLYTIESLLSQGNYAYAQRYAAQVKDSCSQAFRLGICENPIVDAFLFSRTEELRKQGFDIAIQVAVPSHSSILDTDLIIAFGNLVENAVEACQSAGQKSFSIRAMKEKGFLSIETQNPVSEIPVGKQKRIPELERGIGFRILKELAHRYQGSFVYQVQSGVFCANLILKEEV